MMRPCSGGASLYVDKIGEEMPGWRVNHIAEGEVLAAHLQVAPGRELSVYYQPATGEMSVSLEWRTGNITIARGRIHPNVKGDTKWEPQR